MTANIAVDLIRYEQIDEQLSTDSLVTCNEERKGQTSYEARFLKNRFSGRHDAAVFSGNLEIGMWKGEVLSLKAMHLDQ